MRMGNQEVEVLRGRIARQQVFAQFADSRPGVANENGVIEAHFHTRRVAAIDARPTCRRRYGPAGSPKLDKRRHLNPRSKRMCCRLPGSRLHREGQPNES